MILPEKAEEEQEDTGVQEETDEGEDSRGSEEQ